LTKIDKALQLYWRRDWNEDVDGVSNGVKPSEKRMDWPIRRPL